MHPDCDLFYGVVKFATEENMTKNTRKHLLLAGESIVYFSKGIEDVDWNIHVFPSIPPCNIPTTRLS